jgi:hypothetical protein
LSKWKEERKRMFEGKEAEEAEVILGVTRPFIFAMMGSHTHTPGDTTLGAPLQNRPSYSYQTSPPSYTLRILHPTSSLPNPSL